MKICSFLRVGALAVPAVCYLAFAAENAAAQAGAGMPGSPQNGHQDLEPHTAVTEDIRKESARESRKRSSSAVAASRTPYSLGWSKSVGGLASALLAATAVLSLLGKGTAANEVEEELSTETAPQALLPKGALPKVLAGLVLLAVIASTLATPLKEGHGPVLQRQGRPVDHFFQVGSTEGRTVISWAEGQGETFIDLTFGNRDFRLYLASDTEDALRDSETEALKQVLSQSPTLTKEGGFFFWTWGSHADPRFFDMPKRAAGVQYVVRLPQEVTKTLEDSPVAHAKLQMLLQKFLEKATSRFDVPQPEADRTLLSQEERHKVERKEIYYYPPAHRFFNNDHTTTWVLGRGWEGPDGYKDGQHAIEVRLDTGVTLVAFLSQDIEKALSKGKTLDRLVGSLSRKPVGPMQISDNPSPDVQHYEVQWGRITDTTTKYDTIPRMDTDFKFFLPHNVVEQLNKPENKAAREDLRHLFERMILRMNYKTPKVIARVD